MGKLNIDMINDINISLLDVLIAILVASLCAWIVKNVYVKYGMSLNNRSNFSNVFIPLAITTSIVITVVKFSLALSLGLVGALSIVRFRVAIKEPEELVYLFVVIAIGLAAGGKQVKIAIIFTVFVTIALAINRFVSKKERVMSSTDIITIEADKTTFDTWRKKFEQDSKTWIQRLILKEISNSGSERIRAVYTFDLIPGSNLSKDKIIGEFQKKAKDTGSSEVQIALLTKRINSLTEHFKKNKKDNHSREGMIKLISKRRRLILYLKKKNFKKYEEIIKKLNLRK